MYIVSVFLQYFKFFLKIYRIYLQACYCPLVYGIIMAVMIKTMKTINKENIQEILRSYLTNNQPFDFCYTSTSQEDTELLGKEMAPYLNIGDIINLNGELGSGKTVFMMGIADFFHIENQVSSPTFTIVNEYDASLPIFHFDVYRIRSVEEFYEDIGLDYFERGVCIIEWGNQIEELLPPHTIHIDIKKNKEDIHTRYFYIRRN